MNVNDIDTRHSRLLVGVVLSILVLTAYWGVTGNGFINYDDPAYVLENRHVKEGLSWDGLIWAFTTSSVSNWHPLTWLSLMLDYQLFGMVAAGYHGTNLILHLISGLVLFLAFVRMTGRIWSSSWIAGFFLLHPLHVESVAWIAERKDVLSGLFWMLGMWGYARYAEQRCWDRYAWVLLFFILGLLSKPMVVTFPFVLLLLDWWPLGRMNGNFREKVGPLVYEKIPFFILSAAVSMITYWVQKDWNAVAPLSVISLSDRLLHIPIVYVEYLKLMLMPLSLSIFYPDHGTPPFWKAVIAILTLLAITFLSFFHRKRFPCLLMGWLWYLGMLVPVIGFVKVGSQAMADRYTYLPLIGIFMALCFAAEEWGREVEYRRRALWVTAVSILSLLLVFTIFRVGKWKDSDILFTDAIAHTRENYLAYYMLGMAKVQARDIRTAKNLYQEAIRIRPLFVQAQNSLGHLLMMTGDDSGAEEKFHESLRIRPDFAPALKNMGDIRLRQKKWDQAVDFYRRAISHKMEDPELLNNYGIALVMKGERENAINHIREALRLKPDYREAQENLRIILQARHDS